MAGDKRVSVGYVGKSKMKPHSEHSWGGGSLPVEHYGAAAHSSKGGITRSTAEQLYFQLKEFDDFRQPSFNVLYVQTPRPTVASAPILAALGATFQETAELLAPLTRLGIPHNSIKDKLPHFREDYSPLPNTVRPRVQKVLSANMQYAEQIAANAQQAAVEWADIKKEAANDKRGGWIIGGNNNNKHTNDKQRLPVPPKLRALQRQFDGGQGHSIRHIPQPKFLTGEMPIWVIPALNFSAYVYICGFAGLDFFKH